jgi:hypothetical protein
LGLQELWQCGIKRILWVSTSRDLAYDARRDLNDMGATNIPVFPKASTSPVIASVVFAGMGVQASAAGSAWQVCD